MFYLDQNTLVIVAAGVTLLIAILLSYLRSISKQIKGPNYWSAGGILISFGLFLFAFYSYFGSYTTFVIGGAFITLGIALYHAGLRKFRNKKIVYWLLVGLPLAHLIQGTILTIVLETENLRMLIYSLLNICIAIAMILEFRKLKEECYKKVSDIGILVFFVFGLSMAIRMISTYALHPSTAADDTAINKLIFISTILSQILMAFVFILLFNIKLSEELKDQVKNRDRFFSIISHDLNGPVSTISEMLKTINKTELFNSERRELLLSELEKLSSSTSLLLQNLLQWSSNQVNNIKVSKKNLVINELVQQNIDLLGQAAKAKSILVSYTNRCKSTCFADPMMVDTILRNLISNAIKFTPQYGKINIESDEIEGIIEIRVKDNGLGMSSEIVKKLENKQLLNSSYGTEGEKGAGLGLLLCKDFIEKNNGSMHILSKKNSGTEIKIKLPIDLKI